MQVTRHIWTALLHLLVIAELGLGVVGTKEERIAEQIFYLLRAAVTLTLST